MPGSRVISVSLKDRSAVILGGRGADLAVWFDTEKKKWVTSGYYPMAKLWRGLQFEPSLKSGRVQWISEAGTENFTKEAAVGSTESLTFPAMVHQTFEVAQFLTEKLKLGEQTHPDLLLISVSSHDLAGHQYGPLSPEMKDMTIKEDRSLGEYLSQLSRRFSDPKKDLWIALTADHGVAPMNVDVIKNHIQGGTIAAKTLESKMNDHLAKNKIGLCAGKPWVEKSNSFHFYFNKNCKSKSPVQRSKALQELSTFLRSQPGVEDVITTEQAEKNNFPYAYESEAKFSYVLELSGDLILIPQPYWVSDDSQNAKHITSFTYDRTVPVIFWGEPFRRTTIKGKVSVLDIAATLSFALGLVPPAHSQGQVIPEAFETNL